MKRILKRELKVFEIAAREGTGTSALGEIAVSERFEYEHIS